MIWIRNGIRAIRSMARDGLMIPPEVITRERSPQELTLRMIEGQILRCLLGPRQRRMIRRVITPCGRGRTAINIGSKLPHQEIIGSLNYDQKQRCQVWPETPQRLALHLNA